MSSSFRKIESARANGAKSQGPVTVQGRARSSLNALRHGLTASSVVLSNESHERFEIILQAYVDELAPLGQVEWDLVEELAVAKWRLRRNWAVETAALDLQMDRGEEAILQEFNSVDQSTRLAVAVSILAKETATLSLLHRYETRLNRIYMRALTKLKELQAARPQPENTPVQPEPRKPVTPENSILRNEPNPISGHQPQAP